MNISHVTPSYYHHQGNSMIEQLHWTLHDPISKKVSDSLDTWDIYLNQVLATRENRKAMQTKTVSTQNFKYMTPSILNSSSAKVSYKVHGILIIE